MRWRDRRQSTNVEDRRSVAGPVAMSGGIGVMILALIIALLGGNPQALLQQNAAQQAARPAPGNVAELSPAEQEIGDFMKTVFADTEDIWTDLFRQAGYAYQKPTLVLFKGHVQSGCGAADSGMGPFYCPADQKVYIDTSFFEQLARQMGAPGDFAQAYVVAHEVGHHVQHLLGYTTKVDQARRQLPELEANKYSVALELQADFFAGVMLHHGQQKYNFLEPGDVEEGLNAAKMIGDDILQKRARGYATPETFNHGSSEQRQFWFAKGLKTGDLSQGDTFGEMGL